MSKSTEELHKKIDLIFEDLAFGHNFEYGGKAIKELFDQEFTKACLDERNSVALDNYRGQTFSDFTNYKGKFDKFIENNERRIKFLTAQLKGDTDE